MATIQRFEDLQIWQLARVVSKRIFEVTKSKGFVRNYHITDQILRSSGSVMDNIAEGFGRAGNKEFLNYLSIAKGSCSETRSQIYRALDYGYIDDETFEELLKITDELSAKIQSLINHLKKTNHKGPKFQ